jgi:hypothetical protein
MAARLKLTSGTLPFIWNVSARVGPTSDCANRATDVELMKLLLVTALNHPGVRKFGINGTSLPPPRDRQFDPILGFWIFRLQQLGKNPVIDGIASPALGTSYAPGTPWVIFWFNQFAKEADEELWLNLPRNVTVSPELRAELTR